MVQRERENKPCSYLLKVVNVPLEDLHTPLLGGERSDVPDTHCGHGEIYRDTLKTLWTWRDIEGHVKDNVDMERYI